MASAILDAVAGGERDFLQLQRRALDVIGMQSVQAVERRKLPRVGEQHRAEDEPRQEGNVHFLRPKNE